MSRISTKINLCSLKHARRMMKSQTGEEIECLVIPIDANNLFKGEKGIYLDMVGFDLKAPKDKQTHIIKQSLPSEKYEALSQAEKEAVPTLGSHIVWQNSEIGDSQVAQLTSEDDDLPF